MVKGSSGFNCSLFDGFDRCEYCQCILFHVDDYLSVCLKCGCCFTSSNLEPTSLFDTSADSRGKEDHEI